MSLYDDVDKTKTTDKVAGWSSGIKLLQSQLQLKKAATTQPKREQLRKATQVLAPVIDLKSKKDDEENISVNLREPLFGWHFDDEYDPKIPNDYDKVVKDLRLLRDREIDREEKEKKRESKRKSRFETDEAPPSKSISLIPPLLETNVTMPMGSFSGFAGRWNDEEDEFDSEPTPRQGGGVAIAPPPSLQDSPPSLSPPHKPTSPLAGISYGTSSVAAKIMAKYGFKEGQGLGKKEQGMSIALQVEKTSKRGGRIIHEKEILMPPPSLPGFSDSEQMDESKCEPTITEIMKSPSKIVLLRNMVGPGEVDEDLEPEVKDECNSKYGDVIKVIIYELKNQPADEAVRIFVEFKRIESAIKAVVDLNGRFFGGRNVKAGFYDVEKFANLQLLD